MQLYIQLQQAVDFAQKEVPKQGKVSSIIKNHVNSTRNGIVPRALFSNLLKVAEHLRVKWLVLHFHQE